MEHANNPSFLGGSQDVEQVLCMLKHDKEVLMKNRLKEKEWLHYPKRKELINNSLVMFKAKFYRRRRVRNNNIATYACDKLSR